MADDIFNQAYKQLNTAQLEAVDAIEGPVMVIAGPGTGKTQILTLRIANILRLTDTAPENILALTFTESGVYSMRKRLVSVVGSAGFRVNIFTFHGFANYLITKHPDYFPTIIGSVSASEIDQIKIVEEIIEETDFKTLKPFGDKFYYVSKVIPAISQLKRENITTTSFKEFIEAEEKEFENIEDLHHEKGPHKGKMKGKYIDLKKKIEKNRELLVLYEKYQQKLGEFKLYDYDDMIVSLVSAMKKEPDFLLTLQEEYQYVLADEHQDANQSQNSILELLSNFHNNPNLFIVGDEKQAIFAFQGASLDNFLYFKKLYPESKIIFLEENYRSTQTILDSAHSLMQSVNRDNKEGGLRVRLKSVNSKKEAERKIKVFEFSNTDFETYFLADDISKKINSGVFPGSIAVFTRDNKDSLDIVKLFSVFDIPVVLESDQNILQDSDVKKFILLLRAIESIGDDEILFGALHLDFFEIDDFYLYKLARFTKRKKTSFYEAVFLEGVEDAIPTAPLENIRTTIEKIKKWHKISKNETVPYLFDSVISESGLLEKIIKSPDSFAKIELFGTLFNNLKSLSLKHKDYQLKDFLNYVDLLGSKNISINKKNQTYSLNSVHLMTAHKSKGLEFDFVYIVNARDGHWGGKRNRGDSFKLPTRGISLFDKEEDERRLFYVAITRAKKEVYITYAESDISGKKQMPTGFLSEIDQSFLEQINTSILEKELKPKMVPGQMPAIKTRDESEYKEYLNSLFIKKGLSATGLNNYLACPWRYFYSTLLMIPSAQSKSLVFGTAIHEALKIFFNKLNDDNAPNKEILLDAFKEKISESLLSVSDQKDFLEKGIDMLSGYYDFYKEGWVSQTINELNTGDIVVDDIPITIRGNIDKIEILDDDLNVVVVDYKTGKAKSRNEIEGKTKGADGNYKRQLVFYKLLLDNYLGGKYKMVSGEIDFIGKTGTDSDGNGKYKKEKFVIEDGEVRGLKETIKRVTDEILSLSFWQRRCEDKDCKYCALRDLM